MNAKLAAGIFIVMFLLDGAQASAQRLRVGDKVMPKKGAKYKLENGHVTQLGIELQPWPTAVSKVKGDWLWIGREWIRSSHAVRLDQALDYYDDWLRREPNSADAHNFRGCVWGERLQNDKAVEDFTEALRLGPKKAVILSNRGVCWSQLQEYDKAITDFDDAISLEPTFAPAYTNRGIAWNVKKEYEKALTDFAEAMRLDPEEAKAYNARAFLRATARDAKFRDGQKAVEEATKACEMTSWLDADAIGTLAAAYAEAGDFRNAIKWQEKKHAMAPPGEQDKIKMANYKQQQPIRLE